MVTFDAGRGKRAVGLPLRADRRLGRVRIPRVGVGRPRHDAVSRGSSTLRPPIPCPSIPVSSCEEAVGRARPGRPRRRDARGRRRGHVSARGSESSFGLPSPQPDPGHGRGTLRRLPRPERTRPAECGRRDAAGRTDVRPHPACEPSRRFPATPRHPRARLELAGQGVTSGLWVQDLCNRPGREVDTE